MSMKYNPSIGEIVEFLSEEGAEGFSLEEVEMAEQHLGVKYPKPYRDYLLRYGKSEANDVFNHIVEPREEMLTTHEYLAEDDLVEDCADEDDPDDIYTKLSHLPQEQWETVLDNYVLIWFENQGCWSAGYRMKDLQAGIEDPPIYLSVEDDFVTYKKVSDNLEDFLWEMLREAAFEAPSEVLNEKEEIAYWMDKLGIDKEKLALEHFEPLNDRKARQGACLDEEHGRLYFYYERDDSIEFSCATKDEMDIVFDEDEE